MFRWLGMALLGSLIVAVLALGIGGWRVQTAVADRIDGLAEELASIHREQQQLLARQPADAAPEIRGRAYLGDASRPAAGAEIEIWNASEMTLFRRLRTEGDGRFRSHSLPPGDYFVLAPLLAENGKQPYATVPGRQMIEYRVQSQPLYVYAGSEPGDLELDVQLRFGQISFEIAAPPPAAPDQGDGPKFVYRSRLILACSGREPQVPTDPNGAVRNHRWPIVGNSNYGPWGDWPDTVLFGGSAGEPLQILPALMAGQYEIAMIVWPYFAEGPFAERSQMVDQEEGQSRLAFSTYPEANAHVPLEVADGARIHLKITLPEEIEATWRDLQSRHSEDEKEIRAWLEPRPAKIEIVADQPLLPVSYVPDVFPDRATP